MAKIYKSPLDMSAEEWDKNLGQATSNTDFTKPGAIQGRVNFTNRNEFLRKHGLDKFYEFDGGDLWNINYDDNDKEIADYPMTSIRVGYGEPSWDEEKLLDEIEKLGRWKRPKPKADPAIENLKKAGWSDERIANAEKGAKQKYDATFGPIEAKLREFGYSDEDIDKLTDEDLKIAQDFFGRFNNPKPRR